MKTSQKDRDALVRIFEQIPFNEEDFIWYVLNIFIHCHDSEFPVLELGHTTEMAEVEKALKNLFKIVEPFDL